MQHTKKSSSFSDPLQVMEKQNTATVSQTVLQLIKYKVVHKSLS